MAKSKMSQTSQKQPATTRANELYQKKRREEMEAKAAEKERKEKEEADRIARQNALKAQNQARFKQEIKPKTNTEEEARKKRKDALEQEKQQKESIKACIEKGRTRKMLIDSYNDKNKTGNLARVKAIVGLVDQMKQTGVPEKEALSHLND